MLLGLTALSALFIVLAPYVIGVFGDPGGDRSLAVGLSQVLFPIVALLGGFGIVVGILNTYNHFTIPALSPVVWNAAIIVGLVIGVPQAQTMNTKLYVYAASILVATVIQTLLPFPWLRRIEHGEERLRVLIDWRDPMVKRTFVLMGPVALGLGLINVNAVIDQAFASRYVNAFLAPTAIQKSFLVYMLPQGIFSVAITTVLFPTLSRLAARGDMVGFRETPRPRAPADRIPADPGERALRGALRADHPHPLPARPLGPRPDARRRLLPGRVLGRARVQRRHAHAQPGFFSLQSNWIPTIVALANLALNALLDLAFYRLGAWGIPLATAVVNVFGTVALLILLRRRIGPLEGRETAATVIRVLAASAAVALVAYVLWEPLDSWLGRSLRGAGRVARRRARRVDRGLLRRVPAAPRARARCRGRHGAEPRGLSAHRLRDPLRDAAP